MFVFCWNKKKHELFSCWKSTRFVVTFVSSVNKSSASMQNCSGNGQPFRVSSLVCVFQFNHWLLHFLRLTQVNLLVNLFLWNSHWEWNDMGNKRQNVTFEARKERKESWALRRTIWDLVWRHIAKNEMQSKRFRWFLFKSSCLAPFFFVLVSMERKHAYRLFNSFLGIALLSLSHTPRAWLFVQCNQKHMVAPFFSLYNFHFL